MTGAEPSGVADDIATLLERRDRPLTAREIAAELGLEERAVDRSVWALPTRFVWQPGHRWAVGPAKEEPAVVRAIPPSHEEALDAPLAPRPAESLHAVTLTNGQTISLRRRPLDTPALFAVTPRGNELILTLNETHPIFDQLPVPYAHSEGEAAGSESYAELLALLLEAWAMYEDSLPSGLARRLAQDARSDWGRHLAALARERRNA